jgi:hypothetical protein
VKYYNRGTAYLKKHSMAAVMLPSPGSGKTIIINVTIQYAAFIGSGEETQTN